MIKSGDSKEIRLKEFSYALERMESLKSGNELKYREPRYTAKETACRK